MEALAEAGVQAPRGAHVLLVVGANGTGSGSSVCVGARVRVEFGRSGISVDGCAVHTCHHGHR